jgi:hypothetical protein
MGDKCVAVVAEGLTLGTARGYWLLAAWLLNANIGAGLQAGAIRNFVSAPVGRPLIPTFSPGVGEGVLRLPGIPDKAVIPAQAGIHRAYEAHEKTRWRVPHGFPLARE